MTSRQTLKLYIQSSQGFHHWFFILLILSVNKWYADMISSYGNISSKPTAQSFHCDCNAEFLHFAKKKKKKMKTTSVNFGHSRKAKLYLLIAIKCNKTIMSIHCFQIIEYCMMVSVNGVHAVPSSRHFATCLLQSTSRVIWKL